MYTKLTHCMLCVLALGSVASAARVDWTGSGGDKRWDNPANWQGKKVPTSVDEVYVDVPAAAGPNGPVIREGMEAKALGLACEAAGEPNMAMTGGTLEIADWIWWGDGNGSHGTFHMSGGTITVVNEHELGWDGGTGTWIMTGGTVSAGRLIIPTGSGAAGQLYLHGGTYTVGSGGLSMTATGLIDVTEGTLLLEGDQTAALQQLIGAGQITAYDGAGYFDLDYDRRNAGVTTLTAAPLTGKAYKPNPADGATGVTLALLQWQPGLGATLHDVYIGTSPDDLTLAGRQPIAMYYHLLGFTPGATYYWRVDEVERDLATIHTGDVWSFTMAPEIAYEPRPWDGARWVAPDVELSWTPGVNAMSHDIYFGTDETAVQAGDAGVFQRNQPAARYSPGPLAENTTYYWRIDEHAAGDKVNEGAVWSFTTIGPGGGVNAQYFGGRELAGSPVLTRIEDAIDHQWGNGEVAAGLSDQVSARWTANLEAPFTETYTLITTSDDGVRLWLDGRLVIDNWTDHGTTDNRVKVDLIAGQVYSVRMEWYDSGGGAVAQLSWQSASIPRQIIPFGWLQLPVRATSPYPANTAVDVPQALTLRWSAGADAAQHEVYFGQDRDTVAGATAPNERLAGDVLTYDPGALQWNTTYYWRVDEVDTASADSPWKGSVWSFTTADFIVVDDFERYTNEVGDRVFQTWLDGWGYTEPQDVPGNGTGSTVGHDIWSPDTPYSTIMETSIVYAGSQSMPMGYNNADPPYYSEVERTWPVPQNWTVNGVDTLTLHVRGIATNAPGSLYVALVDSAGRVASVPYGDPGAVTSEEWLKWSIPLADFTDVNPNGIKKMYIGVGDRDAPTQGGGGSLFIDEIRVTRPTVAQ